MIVFFASTTLYIMFFGDREEIVSVFLEERTENKKILGEKQEAKIWTSLKRKERLRRYLQKAETVRVPV